MGEEEVGIEIKEELLQVIRNKKKKKSWNKRTRSMREIQNRVLSARDKLKREKGEKMGKEKESTRIKEKMVNLSLSDSDISNCRRVILREAKKTWEWEEVGFQRDGG